MCGDEEIAVADLPRAFRSADAAPEATPTPAAPIGQLRDLREAWLAPLERRYLTELLAECEGNVRLAARTAGVNPVTMYRLLKKRGITISREVRTDDD